MNRREKIVRSEPEPVNNLRGLIVSHTYTSVANHGKLDAIARSVPLGIVSPKQWPDVLVNSTFQSKPGSSYSCFAASTIGTGIGNRYLVSPLTLIHAVRELRPTLIQVEAEPGSLVALQTALVATAFYAKLVVFTWENHIALSRVPLVEQVVLRRAAGVIAGSMGARRIVLDKGFRRPILVLPQLGVSVDQAAAPSSTSNIVVGFVGRFVAEKGILDLLEAARGLANVKLSFLGGGPLDDLLRREATSPEWGGRLEIHSSVPHAEVQDFLRSLSVLVLPSRTTERWAEQFGHVLIEAMALGIPCIGSTSGAIPEVIGDAGLIVPEAQPELLRRAIQLLAADAHLRKNLGLRAIQRVSRHFTDTVIADRTVQFWSRLLEKHAR